QKMFNLLLTHYFRKSKLLSRIQFRGQDVRLLKDIFVEKGAAVCYTFTLGIANTMCFFDKQNVFPNVSTGYFFYLFIPVVLEQQPHFHAIISNRTFPVVSYDQGLMELSQPGNLVRIQRD